MNERTIPRTAATPSIGTQAATADQMKRSAELSANATGEAPRTLTDRYELRELLAKGGMGSVHAAWDKTFDRTVAVKLIHDHLVGEHAIKRFRHEAHIAGQLQHPNIPPVYDLGVFDVPTAGSSADKSGHSMAKPYLAMKLVKGRTLDDHIQHPGPDTPNLVAVFEAIAQAIGYAHSRGVIHRDLKPQNVMVGAFGEVQVMDWGLAKVLANGGRQPFVSEIPQADSASNSPVTADPDATTGYGTRFGAPDTADDTRTAAGIILGTPAYIPPEQARGEIDQIAERSDVFGLGAILYAILTGHSVFGGGTAEQARRKAAAGDMADAFTRLDASTAEPELIALAKWCLEPDPADRPANGTEVANETARIRAEADERARKAELDRAKTSERQKRRRTQWILLGTVLLLLVVGATAVGFASLYRIAEANRDEAVSQRGIADTAKGIAERAQQAEAVARGEAEREREKSERYEYGRTMQVAHQVWRDNNVSAALALLNMTREDLRGWEWHYVNRLCHSELLILRHKGFVRSVSFSPDGSRVVTGSGDKTAKVWDAKTGADLHTLRGHLLGIQSVSFSPDGSRVVTGSWDKTAKLWDAKTGAELRTLLGHSAVYSVSFSPEGSRVLTGSGDKTAKVWDANSGAELLTLQGHSHMVQTASFSPDGSRVVTGSVDRTAKVWSAATGAELLTLTGHTDNVLSASFSPDGSRVLTGSVDRTAKVWDAKTGSMLLALRGHTNIVESASFNPDGSRVVTASWDMTAKVWDALAGAEVRVLQGHSSAVESVAFSPDSSRVVTGSLDRLAKVWDARTGAEILVLRGHLSGIETASFSPDSTRVVTGGQDRTAKVWNATTGAELLTLKGHTDSVTSASFSPDSTRVVTGSMDRTAKIWDAKSGALQHTLMGHTGPVMSASFSTDGSRVVTGSDDQTAKVWDAESGAELLTLKHTSRISSASFNKDRTRVVTGCVDGTAKVWDAKTGVELLTLKGHTGSIRSASYSKDGTRVVTASSDQTAKVWDAESGAEVLTLKGHTADVTSASFSPDGTRVVTGGWDLSARVWDARPFRENGPADANGAARRDP
jgi:WD40 repeat protein/serine/threonine protein kinase